MSNFIEIIELARNIAIANEIIDLAILIYIIYSIIQTCTEVN